MQSAHGAEFGRSFHAAGRDHPYRKPCVQALAAVDENPNGFVTDAEVFQEIMHHYRRTQRWDVGQVVVESFASMMHGRATKIDINRALRKHMERISR